MNYFKNAEEAFEFYYDKINKEGISHDNTKALFNVGFTIDNPLDNNIQTEKRSLNLKYAEAEWQWYLSGDPSLSKLKEIYGKVPKIWSNYADELGNVRSNYGWQWNRNDQIGNVVSQLSENKLNRRAVISIYDGKELSTYQKDTPCTLAIHFQVINNKLHMTIMMRSNDLYYGFCNDQYCFSKLQEMIAKKINLRIGTYYHFATNLHLYNNKLINNG